MKTLYLVTGAAGYLGGEVCRQIVSRGLQGRALVLPGDKTAKYIPKEIEQCEGDLFDVASLERFFQVEPGVETIVLHCASMVALGNERRELVMKVNVQGTQNIIDQCFAHPECKKLVYVGSTGSLPELPHGQKMKEPKQFEPDESLGVYGQSKAMASQKVLDAAKAGLNACIVMPSGILGPGDAACGPVTSGLLVQMRGEASVGLKGTFNLCDVRDLADGIFLAVEKGKAGEAYILANEVVSYPEFAKLTAQEGHCKKPLFYLPTSVANLAADILEKQAKKSGTKPALTRYEIYNLARYITGAAIPVDGALSAGHQSISSWKHPEILTGGKLNSQSTIAALMENEAAKAIVDQYLPGFAENQQAKAAYGMTFGKIGPMLGLPETALNALLDALDNL